MQHCQVGPDAHASKLSRRFRTEFAKILSLSPLRVDLQEGGPLISPLPLSPRQRGCWEVLSSSQVLNLKARGKSKGIFPACFTYNTELPLTLHLYLLLP